jgi:hypothetical protein
MQTKKTYEIDMKTLQTVGGGNDDEIGFILEIQDLTIKANLIKRAMKLLYPVSWEEAWRYHVAHAGGAIEAADEAVKEDISKATGYSDISEFPIGDLIIGYVRGLVAIGNLRVEIPLTKEAEIELNRLYLFTDLAYIIGNLYR